MVDGGTSKHLACVAQFQGFVALDDVRSLLYGHGQLLCRTFCFLLEDVRGRCFPWKAMQNDPLASLLLRTLGPDHLV